MEYWLLPYLAPMFFIPCKSSLYYLRYQLLSALLTTSPGFDRISEGLLHRWGRSAEELVETVPGGLYVKVVPPPDTNKNTSWFQYPGIWTTYILIILFSWLAIVSAFQCQPGTAWTVVNLVHFAVRRCLCSPYLCASACEYCFGCGLVFVSSLRCVMCICELGVNLELVISESVLLLRLMAIYLPIYLS